RGHIGAEAMTRGRSHGVELDGHAPTLRQVLERHFGVLGSAVRHVQKDRTKIEKRMVRIQLRRKGSWFIPEDGVTHNDNAVPRNCPRLLIEHPHGELMSLLILCV